LPERNFSAISWFMGVLPGVMPVSLQPTEGRASDSKAARADGAQDRLT